MSHKKKIKTAFSAKRIAARVGKLAHEIRKDAGSSEVFLLGVLKGTSCFMADLLRAIPGDVSYGFIDVVRDIADAETATALEIDYFADTDIGGKDVYLLKDVVSTGVIENYLIAQLRQRKPKTLKLVALLDRPGTRTVDIATDYRLFEIEEGSFVGYGLELQGRHGNLPYIGRM
ncbi:MAG TPA: phosphoribosyltransferase family protein [Thermoanaerobaculia bacterium]|nr:phosphoribosyltransferase family protein [Thermoanaerobaculia bacterium]